MISFSWYCPTLFCFPCSCRHFIEVHARTHSLSTTKPISSCYPHVCVCVPQGEREREREREDTQKERDFFSFSMNFVLASTPLIRHLSLSKSSNTGTSSKSSKSMNAGVSSDASCSKRASSFEYQSLHSHLELC